MFDKDTAMTSSNGVTALRNVSRPREIVFAEDTLQITTIWRDLEVVTDRLTSLLHRKSIKLMEIAGKEETAAAREREIILDHAVENAEPARSIAARDREIKEALLSDENYQQLEQAVRAAKAELSQIEVDLESGKVLHRSLLARLNSVAEYMNFLGSARDARTVAEAALPY